MPHASREAMTRNKPDDMPWLINGALTSMTFRRLAHAEGRYRTSLAEAKSRGYPTPPTSDPTSQTTERDTRADAAWVPALNRSDMEGAPHCGAPSTFPDVKKPFEEQLINSAPPLRGTHAKTPLPVDKPSPDAQNPAPESKPHSGSTPSTRVEQPDRVGGTGLEPVTSCV